MTTNTTTPSREEMIREIEKVVANKELSFGCRLKDEEKIVKYIGLEVYGPDDRYDSIWDGYRVYTNLSKKMKDLENFKIIGHPVMIGDVLEWIENNILNDEDIEYQYQYIFRYWLGKHLPINKQSNECVKFVYNLIS